ncbi:MAG: hypothetical protein HOQ05_14415 [Corynebacteriales bacterium]|nr:hypothetical protein [Mycobacteriales bacterium]
MKGSPPLDEQTQLFLTALRRDLQSKGIELALTGRPAWDFHELDYDALDSAKIKDMSPGIMLQASVRGVRELDHFHDAVQRAHGAQNLESHRAVREQFAGNERLEQILTEVEHRRIVDTGHVLLSPKLLRGPKFRHAIFANPGVAMLYLVGAGHPCHVPELFSDPQKNLVEGPGSVPLLSKRCAQTQIRELRPPISRRGGEPGSRRWSIGAVLPSSRRRR